MKSLLNLATLILFSQKLDNEFVYIIKESIFSKKFSLKNSY